MKEIVLALFCCFLAAGLAAQEADIEGKVTDEEGTPLIGATIRVVGAVVGASSDIDGHYRLAVPPGRIRIVASYLGFENFDTIVRVTNLDRALEVDIEMRESFSELGEVIVTGRRATGQLSALRVQQSALVNQTIIHADLFNKYPDVTLAETVQRMPGVTITRNRGEAEQVQVRGLPEQYTAISVNGQRLPSIQPEGDRAGGLDIIQSNLVEEVRVIKSRTADMDADAIGGTVDFRLRQPQEKFETLLQGGIGTNFGFDENPDQSSGITQATAYLNSELKDEGVYLLLAGTYFRHGRGSRTANFDYGRSGVTGTELFASRPFDLDRDTKKTGFLGAIELRPSIYNRLRLSYNYSGSNEDFLYRQANFDNRAPGQTTINKTTSGFTQERNLHLVTLEVENNFPKTRLDYTVSFASTSDRSGDRLRLTERYFSPGNFTDNELLTATPYTTTGAETPDRRVFLQENAQLKEDIAIGGANLTRFVSESKTSFVRVGARYRVKDRTKGSFFDARELARDGFAGANTFAALPEESPVRTPALDSLDDAYDSTEEILGGYVMYAANWSSRITTSIGVRYERTNLSYILLNEGNERDISYDNLFPSLNLTFRRSRDRQFRLSYYEAIARPGYGNLVPVQQYQTEINQILRGPADGEADLEPTISRNLDLTFERYGRRDGLLQVGLFAKFLEDPTVKESQTFDRNGQVYRVTRLTNTEEANLYGLEIGFYQNFGFIDPQLRFISLNGTYNNNILNVESRDARFDNFTLPQAPRQSANLSLVYSNPNNRLNVVIASNFRDRVFDRVQDDQPIYLNSRFGLDLSADVELVRDLSIYARVNNLTDHRYEEWIDEPNNEGARLISSSQFGVWGVVGLRFRPRN